MHLLAQQRHAASSSYLQEAQLRNSAKRLAPGSLRPSKISSVTKRFRFLEIILTLLLIGTSGYTGYIAYKNHQVNKATDAVIDHAGELTDDDRRVNGGSNVEANSSQDAKITDSGVVIPSSDKPSRAQIMAYAAPEDYPKRISVPGLALLAKVTTVDDNRFGEIGVPANIYNAAWYVKSSPLGRSPGSSVIVGHTGFRSVEGVFSNLGSVKIGDRFTVVLGDNTTLNYIVTNKQSIDVNQFRMADYLSYQNSTDSLLHLISCDGYVYEGTNSYSSRLVVSAKLI